MKIGIIGVGVIAQIHIPAILSANQDVVALCDVDLPRCFAAQEKFGLTASVYADYLSMLDTEQLDAVHICTPHYLHAEMVCECLKRNVNVLCEKPLAINNEQLAQIERAQKNSAAQLGVCQQNRFNASVRYVKEYFANKPITAGCGTLCWQRDGAYYASGDWRGKKSLEGGGVLINQALHTLDLLQWFCGMPTSLIGRAFNDTLPQIDVEQTAAGVFETANGKFVINATNCCSASFPISLMFRSGNDEAVIIGDNIILNGKFITRSDGLPIFGKEVWGAGHVTLIKRFYECISHNEKFPIDFYEGQKVVKLITALYRSNGDKIPIK